MILLLCVDYMYRHKYAIHLTFRFVKLRLEVSIQFIKKGDCGIFSIRFNIHPTPC